jgi:two-component system sensor histidine kinase UhpB
VRKHALLSQILVVNTLLIAAVVVAASTAAPLHFESHTGVRQAATFGAAVLATILVNAIVLRRRFAPLQQLLETMERVDVAQPGLTIAVSRNDSREVTRLHQAFNRMLARLGAERAAASAAVVHAQEAERARIARDLHDEVNQALTGVLLRLQAIEPDGPVVRVADNGCGFAGPGRDGGLGLTGMRERARLAGGQLDVRSAPGEGTTVELRL